MLTAIKPVFKTYQCHFTIPTKLTIPSRTKDFYFSKYTPICPWQSTVILSFIQSYSRSYCQSYCVIRSYCRSYSHTVGHTVGHTVILLVIRSYCRSYGHTVIRLYCRSYGHTVIGSYCRSYGHIVGPLHGCLQLYLVFIISSITAQSQQQNSKALVYSMFQQSHSLFPTDLANLQNWLETQNTHSSSTEITVHLLTQQT